MWKRIGVGISLAALLAMLLLGFKSETTYAASGTGPNDALSPVGDTQTVPPHSGQWYYFDVGGGRATLTATLDAGSADGLRLELYTPDEISNWQQRNDKLVSIGVASPQQEHTLGWDGSFNIAGRYYAVAYNDTDAPIQVSVRVIGDAVTTSIQPTPTRRPDPLITPTPLGNGIEGKIVFIDQTGGNMYTVNGDGTGLQRISFGMDPIWNHAGTQIALTRQGPIPGLYTIDPDGGNEKLLYGTNQIRSPDYKPDDSQIVFSFQGPAKGGEQRCFTFRGHRACFTTPETHDWLLGLVNLSDDSYRDIRSSNNSTNPTVNADGVTIAYNDLSIGLMKTTWDGDLQPNPFVGDLRNTTPTYNPLRLMSPVFSPDGTKIVYMVSQPPTWQIAIANADGSDQHLLTSNEPLAYYHPDNAAPQWSPDGKQILFLSNRNGKWEFFLMNADGTGTTQVLKNITDQIPIKYDFQAGRMMSWAK
jgi:hypothetical protein